MAMTSANTDPIVGIDLGTTNSLVAYCDDAGPRILVDEAPVRLARLALVAATAQVLHNGLAVLGVSAPRKM